MSETTFSRKILISAIVMGAIGAFGQAYLLYHELVDCLPYKEIGGGIYQSIARTGILLAPLIAVFVGAISYKKRFWLSLVLPVLLTPLLFAGIFKAFNVLYGFSTVSAPDAFGDFTTAKAAEQFFPYCFSLTASGLIIGAICSVLLRLVARPRKLG